MRYKNLVLLVIGCLSLVLLFNMKVMAAYDQTTETMPFKTDMTDRTMLKEILINQEKTLTLLNEIKAIVSEDK